MQGLFTRAYLGLALVLLVSIAIVTFFRPSNAPQPDSGAHARLFGARSDDFASRLSRATDLDAEARALAQELGSPVQIAHNTSVPQLLADDAARSVEHGRPLVRLSRDGPIAYLPLTDRNAVAIIHSSHPPPPFDGRRALTLAVLALLGIAGVGVALIRPVERQLDAVVDAAKKVGAGDLTARAPVARADAAGRLAESFNTMANQVQQMVSSRESMLHGVSHELRTPLARLRFAFELIDMAEDDDDRRTRIREATADVDELEGLVRELLQYSKLQGSSGAGVTTEIVWVAPMLERLVSDAERVRSEVTITFMQEGEPPQVGIERKLFLRAVGNLVNNAMRYADAEVRVTLVADPTRLRVIVDDDGPGVPEHARERIFDPFSRLDDARSRDTGGTGLGLPIAAAAARAHGGFIEVGDSPLGGARFIWQMPL